MRLRGVRGRNESIDRAPKQPQAVKYVLPRGTYVLHLGDVRRFFDRKSDASAVCLREPFAFRLILFVAAANSFLHKAGQFAGTIAMYPVRCDVGEPLRAIEAGQQRPDFLFLQGGRRLNAAL